MAIITDPDKIVASGQYELATSPSLSKILTIDLTNKKLYLTPSGELSSDGITLKCLYSALKEIWKQDTTAIKYTFPATPITDEQMEFNQYEFGNDASRLLIRTGGWAEVSASGTNKREYAGVVSLGSLASTDQVYYIQQAAGTPVNINLSGTVNQAVQIYGDASNGNFNYRSYLDLFCRTQAKTYASSTLSDIGVSTMTYQVYRFPLANAADTKVTQSDILVDASGVSITWYGTPVTIPIGGVNHDFHVIINASGNTAEVTYMAVQSLLRKATDIDSGSGVHVGKITNELLEFVGDTLMALPDSTGGVYISGYSPTDINRLVFMTDTGSGISYPYVAAIALNFGSNLVADSNAIYKVFFTSVPSGSFGTSSGVVVNNASAVPMAGNVSGQASVTYTFDYDGNTQGGRTANSDAPITAVAIGLATGQYVSATSTITRSTSNSVSLVAPLERNYQNP
jgi:hypothetical protein